MLNMSEDLGHEHFCTRIRAHSYKNTMGFYRWVPNPHNISFISSHIKLVRVNASTLTEAELFELRPINPK